MQVFVRALSGGTDIIVIYPTDTVARLKQVAESRTGVPADQQRFIFAGKPLRDGRTLESYGVVAESTLHMTLRLRGGLAQRAAPPSEDPPDREASNGESCCRCRLESRTIYQQPEHPNDLKVARSQPRSMQVFVKTLSGRTVTVELYPTDTIAQLRQAAECRTGVPADQQRFIFTGRPLRDGHTLESYGVVAESTLHMTLRLRGGPARCGVSTATPSGDPPETSDGEGSQRRKQAPRTTCPQLQHPNDLQVAREMVNGYVAASHPNTDPECAGIGVRAQLLSILERKTPQPLMDVAGRLLRTLGLTHDFRIEEWSYWGDDEVFRTEGNHVGTGQKVIRIALVNSSRHYILLDELAGKGKEPLGLQKPNQGSPFFQGVVRLRTRDGKEFLAGVVDQGQYPWGDDGVLADPLQAITDALQLSAKSGVCNACAYAHVMYGLFVQHRTPTDDVLAAILETEPGPLDRKGSVAGVEESGLAGRGAKPAASAEPAPPGAEEDITDMDVDVGAAPGVVQQADVTYPTSLMPPGLSNEPPQEGPGQIAKATQLGSTSLAGGIEVPASSTGARTRGNGNRGRRVGRGGARGSRGKGRGRPGVGPTELDVAGDAGGPRRTPSVNLEVARRTRRGRVWPNTSRPYHGYPTRDQPPPPGESQLEHKGKGPSDQEPETPTTPPGLDEVSKDGGGTKQGATTPPRVAMNYREALSSGGAPVPGREMETPPPSPTAIPEDKDWVDEGDRAYAMGGRGDVFDFLNEDHHTHHYYRRNSALDRALASKVRAPDGILWGWIIVIAGRQVTVVYGQDQRATFRKLTGTRQAPVAVGNIVPFRRSKMVAKEGRVKTSFAAVRDPDPWLEPEPGQYPVLKAVVTAFDSDDMSGRANVGACNRVCPFALASEYDGEIPMPGSTFAFTPLRIDGRGHPTIPVIDGTHFTYLAAGDNAEVQLGTDLVSGFYAPGRELQKLVESRLGVTATPFIGKTLSTFDYYADECLIARLSETYGMANTGKFGKRVPTLGGISALMSQQELFARAVQPTAKEVHKAVHKELHHFVIPTTGQLSAFAPYLKNSLKRAQESPVPLKITVGVFVSQDVSSSSLYHSLERYCPFGDLKEFPWTKALTIIDGPTCYLSYNRAVGLFTPAVEPLVGYKLLAVTFESTFRAAGTLPRVNEIVTRGAECRKLVSRAGEVDVLISLRQDDPRRTLIKAKHQGAKYCGGHEDTLVVSLPWGRARAFLAATAKRPNGMFAMARLSLHHRDTYTLLCDRDVVADELYELLGAYAVMPIGGHKYRFCTDLELLDLAVILHRQNKFIRRGGINKYRTLRDDHDRYVHIGANSPHPRILSTYHRRLEMMAEAHERIPGRHWHRLSNVPRGALPSQVQEAMKKQEWWPMILPDPVLRMTTDTFHPEVWIGTVSDVSLPTQVQLLEHTIVITPAEALPTGAQKLEDPKKQRVTLARNLQKVAPRPEWEATKYTTFRGYVCTVEGRSRPRDLPTSYHRENGGIEAGHNLETEKVTEPDQGAAVRSPLAGTTPRINADHGDQRVRSKEADFVEVVRRGKRPQGKPSTRNEPRRQEHGRDPRPVRTAGGAVAANAFSVLMQSAAISNIDLTDSTDATDHEADQVATNHKDQNQDRVPGEGDKQQRGGPVPGVLREPRVPGKLGEAQDPQAPEVDGGAGGSSQHLSDGTELAVSKESSAEEAQGHIDERVTEAQRSDPTREGSVMAESSEPELPKDAESSHDGSVRREPVKKAAKKKRRKEKKQKRTKKKTKKKTKKRGTGTVVERKERTRGRRGCNGLGLWAKMGFSETVRANHEEYKLLARPPDTSGGADSTARGTKPAAPGGTAEMESSVGETRIEHTDTSQRRDAEVSAALPEEPKETGGQECRGEAELQLGRKRMRDEDEYEVDRSVRTTIQERISVRRKSLSDLERTLGGRPRHRVTFAQPEAVETSQMGNQPTTPAVRSGGLERGGAEALGLGNSERRSSVSAPRGTEMRLLRPDCTSLQRRNSAPAVSRGLASDEEAIALRVYV